MTIRADHGTGLALSYETDTLIEKINSFFGYNAISTIKITQTNIAKKQLSTPEAAIATPDIVHTVDVKTSTIENENLKAALARLGQGALAHAASGKKSV